MDNAQEGELAPYFGDLSQSEKLSEIQLPLVKYVGIFSQYNCRQVNTKIRIF